MSIAAFLVLFAFFVRILPYSVSRGDAFGAYKQTIYNNIIKKTKTFGMNTYTQILYHIVFGTKYAQPVLIKKDRELLFKYIWGILKNKKCHLYRINGVEDHLHILTHLHPAVSLSSLIKDTKVASSLFIKQQNLFTGFNSWQKGYGAFTHHINDKSRLIGYIKNQEAHHRHISWHDELKKLFEEHGIHYQDEYLRKDLGH